VGGAMGDATVLNLEAWDRDFRINVTSMVMMSKYAIPEMRKQGRGSIVNMSSVSGCKFLVFPFPKLKMLFPRRRNLFSSVCVEKATRIDGITSARRKP
jgi:hypothetical protein